MNLEKGRDLFRGTLILVFAGIAYWANLTLDLILITLMGLMIMQSAITDWCPADIFLRQLGLRRRLQREPE